MPLQKFVFQPGINRESTSYTAEGGWYDGDHIRFRAGMPEKIGGWIKAVQVKFQGSCRALHEWTALDGNKFLALGTHLKHLILWGSQYYDITPIRVSDQDLGLNPFITAGGDLLTVTHVAHGATNHDFVTFSGATTGWDPAPSNLEPHPVYTPEILNREYQIVDIADVDHYRIATGIQGETAGIPAGGGGGGPVLATYQVHTGLDIAVPGTGWGASPWGGFPPQAGETAPPYKGGWGMPYDIGAEEGRIPYNQIRLWAQDNFGEDLVFNIRTGAIYYWKRSTGVLTRAVELYTMPGAPDPAWTPRYAFEIMVSEVDRHVIAIGTNDWGQDFMDPMLIRWSDAENVIDWEPRRNNSAGGIRLSSGSRLRGALRTRQEILIWTDKNLQSMRFIGAPYWFGTNLLAENVSMLAPNAAINASGRVFWMDRNGFYIYSGQVQELPCTVRDYVFGNFNMAQAYKVAAGHNHNFQEVIWFYPTAASTEVDRYVAYNYVENVWCYGNLQRTCWLDLVRSDSFPVGTGPDGYLYHHEIGEDADTEPMAAWIESSDLDIGDGDRYMFLRRIIPDVVFRGSAEAQSVGLSVRMRHAPGDQYVTEERKEVHPWTKYVWTRARGRQMAVRIESTAYGVGWRSGALRFEIQPDGRR